MTEEQRRMERGLLLVAIEEQTGLVTDIANRNDRVGEALMRAGSMLRGTSSNAMGPMPTQQELDDWLDIQKVRDALAELSTARARLSDLQRGQFKP